MKIAMLGGNGFIGSAVTDNLLSAGHEITALKRPGTALYRKFTSGECISWIIGDVRSSSDVRHAIEGADVVMHLVSTTIPKNSNEDPVYDVSTNLTATLRLLQTMADADVRRIVFISSGGTVYGPPQYLPMDERHPTNPCVSYGIVKLAIEKYLLMFQEQRKIKATILRVSNPYGERQRIENAQGVVCTFLKRAMQGLPLEIWGDGNVVRDYLYVGDVADAFVRAVEYDGPESVFNISSGTGLSLNDLVATLEQVLNSHIKRVYRPGRNIDVPVNVLDSQLAKRELSWAPRMSFLEGVAKTIEWMRRNKAWDSTDSANILESSALFASANVNELLTNKSV